MSVRKKGSEQDSAQRARSLEQVFIGQMIAAVLDGRYDVNPTATKLEGNRMRNMDIQVESHSHQG
jgi:hypothetical protein